MSKNIILIPSRLRSKRLKNKPLLEIDNIPLVVHTYKRSKLAKKVDDVFLIKGQLQNENLELNKKEIDFFLKDNFLNSNIDKIIFNSNNEFSFKINKNLNLKDFQAISNLRFKEIIILKDLKLKKRLHTVV